MTLPYHIERELNALGVIAPPQPKPLPIRYDGPLWDGKGEVPF